MFATIHWIFGAAIGEIFSKLWLIAIIAFASHWILDWIPHYCPHAPKNKKEFLIKAIEPTLGLIIMTILILTSPDKKIQMLTGSIFAFLPDVFSYIGYKTNNKFLNTVTPRPGNKFYHELQNKKGLFMQGLFFTTGLILFYIF